MLRGARREERIREGEAGEQVVAHCLQELTVARRQSGRLDRKVRVEVLHVVRRARRRLVGRLELVRLESPPVECAEEATLADRAVRRVRHAEAVLRNPCEQLIRYVDLTGSTEVVKR